ncbi:MAG: single-stranded DNA-binding protein, partial [Marivivens sp.]|nr:single-stranded DNA-binding protein [Marivivens sp.]
MANQIHVTQEPVILEGYQAILKPSKFGYSLSAIVDQKLIERLEDDRNDSI